MKQAQKSADGKVVNKSDLSHNERRKHELEADTPEVLKAGCHVSPNANYGE